MAKLKNTTQKNLQKVLEEELNNQYLACKFNITATESSDDLTRIKAYVKVSPFRRYGDAEKKGIQALRSYTNLISENVASKLGLKKIPNISIELDEVKQLRDQKLARREERQVASKPLGR